MSEASSEEEKTRSETTSGILILRKVMFVRRLAGVGSEMSSTGVVESWLNLWFSLFSCYCRGKR
jgi:hypothetical protein